VLKEALKLLRGSLPSTIEIHQDIDASCGPVMADPGQIHQLIMNLCTNAYQAMQETGGTLTVALAEVDIGPERAAEHLDLEPGPHLQLTVSDTGHGMDEATKERIFEPFFTTKAAGDGTGMGLATVHGIVKSCDGTIHAASEPGKGTTFNVYLPVCVQEEAEEAVSSGDGPPTGGSERILLIDDEEAITKSSRISLEKLGYRVETCTDGVEGLEAFLADPPRFDLVITDQTMPHLTGIGLTPRLLAVRPDIPIILCTGFSHLLDREKVESLGVRRTLTKPVIARDLAQTVREVLDEPVAV